MHQLQETQQLDYQLTLREVDSNGLTILNAQETAQLTKNATLINSLTDPGNGSATPTYDQAKADLSGLIASKEDTETAIAANERVISIGNKNIEEIQQNLQDPDLSSEQRARLEAQIAANQASIAEATDALLTNNQILNDVNEQLDTDQQVIATADNTAQQAPGSVPSQSIFPVAYDDDGNLLPGFQLDEDNNPVFVGAAAITTATNTDVTSLVNQARQQQTVRDLRQNKAQASDWRVRLRLAPNSTYLYKDSNARNSLLAPLALTDGVIFPYTPAIDTAYKANYDAYDLTHSNYRGYFYKGSHVDAINVRAQFTAQDTVEANYLLAVIHFFRSATKMFYGQDVQRGSPPPMVYLNGYGDFQFNEHPCVISQFNYQLPADVDYIRAQSALDVGTNMLNNRIRSPLSSNPLSYTANRLLNAGLLPGALDFRPSISSNLPVGSPTYVPTKMEISITLLPIQSREQVSKNFSVKEFAQGNLLKGGYW